PIMPAETAKPSEPKKPVVTLVPSLLETAYKEEDDTTGTPRTLAYVRAQRAVLKYLDTQASDTLAPHQARRWTQSINPVSKMPRAEEALRLCYYMRSQGYDTGALIGHDTKIMQLYVVIRTGPDKILYWKQNFSTNQVLYTAPSTSRSGRRNALPGNSANFDLSMENML
ncbi:hypothetical protein EK21DRAFT_26989, partial [Setomelanomma holmii]